MRRILTTITAALFIAAGACAPAVSVHSTMAPNANLSKYHTYAFMTPKPGQPQSILDQDIQGSLRASLAQKGFVEVRGGKPDFLVAYHTTSQQQLNVQDWGYSGGFGWGGPWGWGGPEVTATTYTEGTIIVDFVDARTNQAFWRGTASEVIDHPNSPDAGKIATAVNKLIAQYPVTTTAQRAPSGY